MLLLCKNWTTFVKIILLRDVDELARQYEQNDMRNYLHGLFGLLSDGYFLLLALNQEISLQHRSNHVCYQHGLAQPDD
jgi:hypothetical protein